MNSYVRNLNGGDEEENAISLDKEIAVLKDGTRLRISEENNLLNPRDTVKTNYGETIYTIKEVSKHAVYGLDTYSLVVIPIDKPDKSNNHGFLNELVICKGRILKLFEVNKDEVFILKKAKPKGLMRFLNEKNCG